MLLVTLSSTMGERGAIDVESDRPLKGRVLIARHALSPRFPHRRHPPTTHARASPVNVAQSVAIFNQLLSTVFPFLSLQLWHVGRVSHPAYQPDGAPPLAPSPLPCPSPYGVTLPDFTNAAYVTPREATVAEIKEVVAAYVAAAMAAVDAGFDGVEVHSANG